MPLSYTIELTGIPSGQVITIYSAFIQILYSYGFILKHPDYGWTFKDEDVHKIKKILESNICVF